jgi:hypothetical protein
LYSGNPSNRRELYTGNPSIRKIDGRIYNVQFFLIRGFPEYNFPDKRISRVQFFLIEGLPEYNFPDRRISSVGKLCTGNPSIRKIVLWKSFCQENCTLEILLTGENCTLEILRSGKLYSGSPSIWEDLQCTIFPDQRISRVQFS